MIYTLIMTIAFSSGGSPSSPRQIIHIEHDYESVVACHMAYSIARSQANQIVANGAESAATCLAHSETKS